MSIKIDSKTSAMYEDVNRLICEYLGLAGLQKTLNAFTAECNTKPIPCPNSESKFAFTQYDAEKLIVSFNEGDLDGFMKIWKAFLNHIHSSGEDLKKLEVYLRVHFALWPMSHDEPEGIQTQAMVGLKNFFEENSNNLSKDAAILPLFALPFVADPSSHPIFKDLFEPTWAQRLRTQLESTVSKYFELLQENLEHHSKLVSIVMKSQRTGDRDSNSHSDSSKGIAVVTENPLYQERFFQLVETYRTVRSLLRGTRESYGKLLKVSNELILGLEQSVSGKNLAMEPIMERCFIIFPELFTQDILGNGRPDKEYFKKLASGAIFDNILDSDVSLFFVGISEMSPENLNYEKIKTTLVNSGTPDKLCLLQSLRWLLTKSTPKCRQIAMDSFKLCDILGLNNQNPDYREKLFACMLSPTPNYIKECFSRLLNAISSMKTGRSYLSSTHFCLGILVQSLHTFKGENETFICQMVVATLQKMSLRKKMRLGMIQEQVIQWLVVYLKSELVKKEITEPPVTGPFDYNPYLMEYGWALLMNLCLHEESKSPTALIAPDILTCVVQMLMTKPNVDVKEFCQVAPYVISTLYSLLRNPDIFAMAKRMHLKNTFATIVAEGQGPSDLTNHLNHVISVLSVQGYDRVVTTGEVDYDDDDNNDPDEFEPEIEVHETWVGSLDETSSTGDDLLARHYLLPNDPILPNRNKPCSKTYTSKRDVLCRPITPSEISSKSSPGVSVGINTTGKIASVRKLKKSPARANRHKKSPGTEIMKETKSDPSNSIGGSGIQQVGLPDSMKFFDSAPGQTHVDLNLKMKVNPAEMSESFAIKENVSRSRPSVRRPKSPTPRGESGNDSKGHETSVTGNAKQKTGRKGNLSKSRSRVKGVVTGTGSENRRAKDMVSYYDDIFAAVGSISGKEKLSGGKSNRWNPS